MKIDPLVNADDILLLTLHIKLGFIKSFLKRKFKTNPKGFQHMVSMFPNISSAKLK